MPSSLRRRAAHVGRRARALEPTLQGLLWATAAGLLFTLLNGLMRALSLQLDPYQTQFLRYVFGLVVLLPLVWRHGLAAYRPRAVGGQFVRGFVHTVGMGLMFTALPKLALAETTAIGFTMPIFIMLGALVFFREAMRWERWLAAAAGFGGVLIVVGPGLQGSSGIYSLVMLASSAVFAGSFLINKALTRYETTGTILLWQSLTVTLFSMPLALLHWAPPTPLQWAGFVLFGDVPSRSTLAGGVVICGATLWIARRESRHAARMR